MIIGSFKVEDVEKGVHGVPTQVSNQREPRPIHMGALFTKRNPAYHRGNLGVPSSPTEDGSHICFLFFLPGPSMPPCQSQRRDVMVTRLSSHGVNVRLSRPVIHPGLAA